MKRIDVNDLWNEEWYNAYRFFNSKGNLKTRSRLKEQWIKGFKKMLFDLEKTITENIIKSRSRKMMIAKKYKQAD